MTINLFNRFNFLLLQFWCHCDDNRGGFDHWSWDCLFLRSWLDFHFRFWGFFWCLWNFFRRIILNLNNSWFLLNLHLFLFEWSHFNNFYLLSWNLLYYFLWLFFLLNEFLFLLSIPLRLLSFNFFNLLTIFCFLGLFSLLHKLNNWLYRLIVFGWSGFDFLFKR